MAMKVEGHSNLIRDERTSAIINTSDSEYDSYVKKRARFEEMEEVKAKQANMEKELSEMRGILMEIYKKVSA